MITADPAPVFPLCPTFGFGVTPNLLVKIVAREGGYERRNRIWRNFLSAYDTTNLGDQRQEDIEQVIDFYKAVGASENSFRFKDWTDFKSCKLNQEPEELDQPIISSGDSPASFRLVKQWIAGPFAQQRIIQRPIGATILIANQDGDLQSAADWTLDEATGLLSIGGGFSGTPSTWGGEFDYWVRFASAINPVFSNHKIISLTVQLQETRQPLA